MSEEKPTPKTKVIVKQPGKDLRISGPAIQAKQRPVAKKAAAKKAPAAKKSPV